jgi:glycosyltransferase involved in cell wall biosynthesis
MFENNPLVSVVVATFNQQEYIARCLESILGQHINFEIEIIVGDDHSTDNTMNIIRAYHEKNPVQIKPHQSERNLGLIKNYFTLMTLCKGKYIAQCAGDDYWHDPLKLQKQVNFLEENPDFGLVHTDFNIFFQKKHITLSNFQASHNRHYTTISGLEDLILQGSFSALTVMFRKELMQQYILEIDPENQNWMIEDYPFWIFVSIHSKIHYLPESTATYRVVKGSLYNFKTLKHKIDFIKNTIGIEFFFAGRYGLTKNLSFILNKQYHKKNIILSFYLNHKNRMKLSYKWLQTNDLLKWKDRMLMFFCSCPLLRSIYIFFENKKFSYRT